jgi:2-amino-4-hydroxy-6-hydroxymethyldihydropteridine diphosphokinase
MPRLWSNATRMVDVVDVAYVALGSNVGDRHAYLRRGRAALAALPQTLIVGESAIEETAPLGPIIQGAYLNQMVALETSLSPHELLAELQTIEAREGRVRGERWGPRTLDLDIVCFQTQSVDDSALRVPHPELPNRDFWRRELAELGCIR